jgi:hypothetical protein
MLCCAAWPGLPVGAIGLRESRVLSTKNARRNLRSSGAALKITQNATNIPALVNFMKSFVGDPVLIYTYKLWQELLLFTSLSSSPAQPPWLFFSGGQTPGCAALEGPRLLSIAQPQLRFVTDSPSYHRQHLQAFRCC